MNVNIFQGVFFKIRYFVYSCHSDGNLNIAAVQWLKSIKNIALSSASATCFFVPAAPQLIDGIGDRANFSNQAVSQGYVE